MNDYKEKFEELKKNFPKLAGEIEKYMFDAYVKRQNKFTRLSEIQEGMKIEDIEVYVATKISSKKRIKCPACGRTYNNNNVGDIIKCESFVCKGAEQELKEIEDHVYIAGNEDGVILIQLSPEIFGIKSSLEGYYVKLSGKVGKKGVFKSYPDKYIVYVSKIKLLYNIFEENTLIQYPNQQKEENVVSAVEEKEPEWLMKLEATITMAGGSLTDSMLNSFMRTWNLKQDDVLKYLVQTSDGKWSLKKASVT